MEIKESLTSVNFTSKSSRKILGIVLHSMWGTQQGSIAWFKNPDAKASAHYCVSQGGEIVRCVRDKDIAWHAGVFDEPIADWLRPNPNFVTIGVELEDRRDPHWNYPEAQRQALQDLIDHLCLTYGIPKDKDHLLLHKNLNPSRRSDPVGTFSLDWVLGPQTPPPDTSELIRQITSLNSQIATYKQQFGDIAQKLGTGGDFADIIGGISEMVELEDALTAEKKKLETANLTITSQASQLVVADQRNKELTESERNARMERDDAVQSLGESNKLIIKLQAKLDSVRDIDRFDTKELVLEVINRILGRKGVK